MQCATGQDWECKKRDFDLHKWSNILYWPFDPVPGLAIPYVVGESDWQRICDGVLLMDRLRIASVLEGYKFSTQHMKKWWDWCDHRIQEGKATYLS